MTENMQNKMPKNMTEKIFLATKKAETIISYQQIVQQNAPKILRTILSNQLKKMSEEPKPNEQELMSQNQNQLCQIILLTEDIITTPPFGYGSSTCQNQLFSPHKVKNAIYTYNAYLTEMTDLTIKTGNVHILDMLTSILRTTAHNTPSD